MRADAARVRGVVFDFDGTLLDSMPVVLEGLAQIAAAYRPRPPRAEVLASLGGPSEECLRRLLGAEAHVAEALARYVAYFRAHDADTRLFPGARRLIVDLRRQGIRLGIWTGRERSLAIVRLRALDLDRHFNALVCGDDLASHKPDPEGLRQIVRDWGLTPDQVVFVGDSDQDFAAAAAGSVPLVAIRHGREIAPDLLAHPLAVAETPPKAFTCVRRLVRGATADGKRRLAGRGPR